LKKNIQINQYFYLWPTEEKDVYLIQSAATGKYIHISGAIDTEGSSLLTWDGAGGAQTIFRAIPDSNGNISWVIMINFAFDLKDGANVFVQESNGQEYQFGSFSASFPINERKSLYLFNLWVKKFIDTEGARFGNGTNILPWESVGNPNRVFF